MSENLEPCDIFLTRNRTLISRAIRFFTRRFGESRSEASHVAIVVEGGPISEAVVVEALSKVRRHPLFKRYGGKRNYSVAIFRSTDLTEEEKKTIVQAAENYVGRKYGYIQIVGHFLVWFLQGAYVFRRLTASDNYPICSWVVAHAFAKVGKHFGTQPGAASPDDIHDFLRKNPEKYEQVRSFSPLRAHRATP